MSTDVTVHGPAELRDGVAALFEDAERRFSRFRDDSELSRLNRARGEVTVSPPMLDALVAARRHVADTGGLFDPAIGGAIAAAGYDRSFAPGALDRDRSAPPPAPARFAELAIDVRTGRVARPAHLQLDLGGMIKGRTVDAAARLLPGDGFVDAGGDLAVRGDAGWPVDVEDPAHPDRVLLTLLVRDRAVATSAPNRRRWRIGSAWAHHLIDPRTGRPATSELAQATAVAATAEEADVLAKVAFLLGAAAGARFLEARGAAGILVGADGAVTLVGALEVIDA